MKAFLVLIPIIAGSLISACAADPLIPLTPFGFFARGHSNVDSESSVSSGIDPITQAGIDADNAATDEQSRQDVQNAADAAVAASANLTVP